MTFIYIVIFFIQLKNVLCVYDKMLSGQAEYFVSFSTLNPPPPLLLLLGFPAFPCVALCTWKIMFGVC